jgi:hypothetical protein
VDISEADDKGFRWVQCRRERCQVRAHSPFPHDRIVTVGGCLDPAGRSVSPSEEIERIPANVRPPPVFRPELEFGPGTELADILAEAGATSDHCPGMCERHRLAMNAWGPARCRECRQQIIAWLRAAAFKTWVLKQLQIGWSLARESWFDPHDPVGCIVDEAIRRAEFAAVQPNRS